MDLLTSVKNQSRCTANSIGATDFQEMAQQSVEDSQSVAPPASYSHKRKRVDVTGDLIDVMLRMWSKMTDSIDRVASRMGYEMDAAENRKGLHREIGKLSMAITSSQHLKATFAIAKHDSTVDIFYALPDDDKCEVVRMALDGLLP